MCFKHIIRLHTILTALLVLNSVICIDPEGEDCDPYDENDPNEDHQLIRKLSLRKQTLEEENEDFDDDSDHHIVIKPHKCIKKDRHVKSYASEEAKPVVEKPPKQTTSAIIRTTVKTTTPKPMMAPLEPESVPALTTKGPKKGLKNYAADLDDGPVVQTTTTEEPTTDRSTTETTEEDTTTEEMTTALRRTAATPEPETEEPTITTTEVPTTEEVTDSTTESEATTEATIPTTTEEEETTTPTTTATTEEMEATGAGTTEADDRRSTGIDDIDIDSATGTDAIEEETESTTTEEGSTEAATEGTDGTTEAGTGTTGAGTPGSTTPGSKWSKFKSGLNEKVDKKGNSTTTRKPFKAFKGDPSALRLQALIQMIRDRLAKIKSNVVVSYSTLLGKLHLTNQRLNNRLRDRVKKDQTMPTSPSTTATNYVLLANHSLQMAADAAADKNKTKYESAVLTAATDTNGALNAVEAVVDHKEIKEVSVEFALRAQRLWAALKGVLKDTSDHFKKDKIFESLPKTMTKLLAVLKELAKDNKDIQKVVTQLSKEVDDFP